MATDRALAEHPQTKNDTLTAAESVRRGKQSRILKAFGCFDFDPKYDYKLERRRGSIPITRHQGWSAKSKAADRSVRPTSARN